MSSCTDMSAISRPRPITIRCEAVSAISLMRCDDTKIVRPSAASALSRLRIHKMPSGSSPFTGSSRINVPGSPSNADAMPSRWPMPSENPPARLPATSVRPTRSMTSCTRRLEMPVVAARASRWLRADRPVWIALLRATRRPRAAAPLGRRTAVRRSSPTPRLERRGRAACAWSSTCRPRSGRGSRSRCPGAP